MSGINGEPPATPGNPEAMTPAAVAGGVGAMAVCCTLTLLVAAGVIGSLSGAAIGGIAVGAGIALASLVWLAIILIRRRRTGRVDRCPPSQVDATSDADARGAGHGRRG